MGSSGSGRDPRTRKPAPEAGRILNDSREHCFVNEKVLETFEKTIAVIRFFPIGIGITKVHCIVMASIHSRAIGRTGTFDLSFFHNSHSFGLFSMRSLPTLPFSNGILLPFCSAKSANSTVFRIPILLLPEIFLCEACRFQKTSQTSDAQRNTP